MNSYKRNNSVLTFFPSFLNTIFHDKNASIISHIISNWKEKQKKKDLQIELNQSTETWRELLNYVRKQTDEFESVNWYSVGVLNVIDIWYDSQREERANKQIEHVMKKCGTYAISNQAQLQRAISSCER